MAHIKIEYSNGRAKHGRAFAYIRPAGQCSNRSRRVPVEKLAAAIETHFPCVNYYLIDGWVIGAKNEQFALKEYWRICDTSKIQKPFEVVYSHSA
jgi:hypothetical protein